MADSVVTCMRDEAKAVEGVDPEDGQPEVEADAGEGGEQNPLQRARKVQHKVLPSPTHSLFGSVTHAA